VEIIRIIKTICEMKRIHIRGLLCSAFVFCLSCGKNDPIGEVIHDKMVLVYLAGNNDLKTEALESIVKMQRGAKNMDGDLLVFIKTERDRSHLLKIRHSNGNRVASDTLRSYGGENSSDPSFFSRVISDSRSVSAATTYGLVMWSHATAWAPPPNRIRTKSFGYDEGFEMDIMDLKTALPEDFEYILFDACSMASMEVVYELRNNAKYILASPAEVLSTGFPYDEIAPHLFNGPDGLKAVSQKFIDHYRSLPGLFASATVSLIDTKELDGIAALTRELLANDDPKKGFELNKVQKMDYQPGAGPPAYDFLSFFDNNFQAEAYALLKQQVRKAVVYSGHTERFFDIPIREFSGLSIYLPSKNDRFADYYSTLSWSVASGWPDIFQYAK